MFYLICAYKYSRFLKAINIKLFWSSECIYLYFNIWFIYHNSVINYSRFWNHLRKQRKWKLRKTVPSYSVQLKHSILIYFRLGKVLSNKISDNNPGIADLSDENRPTKLGERYRQLYDNQWTEAYEVAEKLLKDATDKQRIHYLLAILMVWQVSNWMLLAITQPFQGFVKD